MRDRLRDARADEILLRNGAMSVQTMAMRHGLDPEQDYTTDDRSLLSTLASQLADGQAHVSVEGLGEVHLTADDVVRHRIVAAIVEAYRHYEEKRERS